MNFTPPMNINIELSSLKDRRQCLFINERFRCGVITAYRCMYKMKLLNLIPLYFEMFMPTHMSKCTFCPFIQ